MTLQLHTLSPSHGSTRPRKRVGRGLGSTGSYSGRGVKGQRARSGGRSGLKLKGMRAMMLKFPKSRGFQSIKPKSVTVNLRDIAKVFADGQVISPAALMKKKLITKETPEVKILGDGAFALKVFVKGCRVSQVAKEKIEKAGGSIQGLS